MWPADENSCPPLAPNVRIDGLRILCSSADFPVGIGWVDEDEWIATLETPYGNCDPTSNKGEEEQEADDV